MRRGSLWVTGVLAAALVAGPLASVARAQDQGLIGGLLGGIGGAVAGAQFGKGTGRLVGTAAGALIGAGLGNSVGNSLARGDQAYYGQQQGYSAPGAYSPSSYTYGPSYSRGPAYGHYDYPPPRRHYREVIYAPPPVYSSQPYYGAPQAAYVPPAQPISGQYCREYTSTVEIGGRPVPAFGTACQQPDGSWKMGPLTAER